MKGLIFSEPMVKAWLEGRMTVMRRLMNPQPAWHSWEYNPSHRLEHTMLLTNKGWYCKFWHQIAQNPLPDGEQWIRAPYQPGETVYIKETWALIGAVPHTRELGIRHRQGAQDMHWRVVDQCIFDRYTQRKIYNNPPRWKSPLFMPEWAAINHALIKSVRPPERVQEITENDCYEEGIMRPESPYVGSAKVAYDNARSAFRSLWESLYPGSWGRNDWVWRIELKKQEGK